MIIRQESFLEKIKKQKGFALFLAFIASAGVLYIIGRPRAQAPSLFSKIEKIEDSAFNGKVKPGAKSPQFTHSQFQAPVPVSAPVSPHLAQAAAPPVLSAKDAKKLLEIQNKNKKKEADKKAAALAALKKKKTSFQVASQATPFSSFPTDANSALTSAGGGVGYGGSVANATSNANSGDDRDKKDRMSAAEWEHCCWVLPQPKICRNSWPRILRTINDKFILQHRARSPPRHRSG